MSRIDQLVPGALGASYDSIPVVKYRTYIGVSRRKTRLEEGQRLAVPLGGAKSTPELSRQVSAAARRIQSGKRDWASSFDFLLAHKAASIGEIAAALSLDTLDVERQLEDLEGAGLVRRRAHPSGVRLFSIKGLD
jgi:hypothetical protein